MNKKPGIDLINWQPDYTKSKEENMEAWRQEYRRVYGEEPPEPISEEEFEKRLRKANRR